MDLEQLVQDVIEGIENPLKAYAILKSEKARVEKCLSEVEPSVFAEAENYSEKTFTLGDWMFEKRSGGRSYSFKHIPEWSEAKQNLKDIEERAKTALSASNRNMLTASEDGEEIILPEVTFRKDSIVIKPLKK